MTRCARKPNVLRLKFVRDISEGAENSSAVLAQVKGRRFWFQVLIQADRRTASHNIQSARCGRPGLPPVDEHVIGDLASPGAELQREELVQEHGDVA